MQQIFKTIILTEDDLTPSGTERFKEKKESISITDFFISLHEANKSNNIIFITSSDIIILKMKDRRRFAEANKLSV